MEVGQMAKFKSIYSELTFYVEGKRHSFYHGEYSTDDPKVIDVLEKIPYVRRVDEVVEEPKKEDAKEEKKAAPSKSKSKKSEK
jgi:hypothetical protein